MHKSNLWAGDSVSLCLKIWFIRDDTKLIKSLPILVLWFIWLARNKCCFEDLLPSSFQVASLCLGMLSTFPQHMSMVRIRAIVAEDIDINLIRGDTLMDQLLENQNCVELVG